jgi:hypothetical protein
VEVLGMVYKPTPEVGRRAENVLFDAISHLKPRHRRDASRVGMAVAKSPMLREAYGKALADGDQDWAQTLAVVSAAFLDSYYMQNKSTSVVVLAILLASETRPVEGAWCKAILNVLREAGRIGD